MHTDHFISECHTIYYHNYRTHKAGSTRTYYANVLSVIQAARHFYLEAALLDLFTATKVLWMVRKLSFSDDDTDLYFRMSNMNCAHIYNYALAQRHARFMNNRHAFSATLPQFNDEEFSWQYTLRMRDTNVMNVFFIYSLLLDKAEHNSCLILPHDEQQRIQIDVVLSERDKEMEGIGQEAYPHARDPCPIVISDDPKCKSFN